MSESIVTIRGSRGDTDSGAPHTVDFRITGTCQLRCDWCWGPEHLRKGSITEPQLKRTLGRLAADGTEQIVFSGGEPTLSKLLRPGVETARERGLRVTLSTNGIKLAQHADILRYVDDLGIPIDGSNPEVNERMRRRSDKFGAWDQAVGAILLAQEMNRDGLADIAITSRTVIARPNLDDVANIPGALEAEGVDIEAVRFKLYQVEPFGPHYADTDFERDWAISAQEAIEAAERTRAQAPDANITLQLYEGTVGRYFLVDPDGYVEGTDEDASGYPIGVPYGNIVHNYEATLGAYRAHQAQIASY